MNISILSSQYSRRGMTLVEVALYTALLSFLMASVINYLYAAHMRDSSLIQRIYRAQGGFIATTAVILLASGCIAFLLVVSGASMSYADVVTRREYRIQKGLNEKACADIRSLMLAKDSFFAGSSTVHELGCVVER